MPSAWPSTGMRVLRCMWLTSALPPLGMACKDRPSQVSLLGGGGATELGRAQPWGGTPQ